MALGLAEGNNWEIFHFSIRRLAFLAGQVLWIANPARTSESLRGMCSPERTGIMLNTSSLTGIESIQLAHDYFEGRVRAALFCTAVQMLRQSDPDEGEQDILHTLEARWQMSLV